jgi:LmbE family N-acetylglucosaminyl deacetylase
MNRVAFLLILTAQLALAAEKPKVILGVFAHPDDETMVSPILARYARQGVEIYLAYATDGQRGAKPFSKIPAGEMLGKARRAEAACSAQTLGAKPPIFFGVMDGDLGAMTSPIGKNTQAVTEQVTKLLDQLHPDAIVTWGPEGGYGHPDHRLVSDAVTQAVQASSHSYPLFYVELDANALSKSAQGFLKEFYGTDPQYLTVHVAYSPADLQVADKAFRCHSTQYTPEEQAQDMGYLDQVYRGHITFRPWFGNQKGDDLVQP